MLVCIDPGHAKNTAGKRSFDGTLREYEFNRDVAKRLKHHLERHGVKTMYSCDTETPVDVSLSARCASANKAKAKLFVSIHANAYSTSWNTANGWEIFIYKGSVEGRKLAESIRKESIKLLKLKDRGIKDNQLYVTTHTNMPAVLIEHGFYTNLKEVEKLKDSTFRENCAIADAKGILNYLGIVWKNENKSTITNVDTNTIPYKVKVSYSNLNMRTGPSTSYPSIGYIPTGIYTIVELNGKWGRIKSKQNYKGKYVDAWIYMGYTTKV